MDRKYLKGYTRYSRLKKSDIKDTLMMVDQSKQEVVQHQEVVEIHLEVD